MADELAGLPQNIAPWFPPAAPGSNAAAEDEVFRREMTPYSMQLRLAGQKMADLGIYPGDAFADQEPSTNIIYDTVDPFERAAQRLRAPYAAAVARGNAAAAPEEIPFDRLRREMAQTPATDIYRQGVGLPPQGKAPSPDFIAPPPMGRVLGAPPGMAIGQPPGVLTQEQAQNLAGGMIEPLGQAGRLMTGASQDVPGDLSSVLAAAVPMGPPIAALPKLRAVFDSVRAAQGNVGIAPISELIARSGLSKEEVHDALVDAARRGDVTLHQGNQASEPQAIRDAAINLPGEPPLKYAFFKDQPKGAPPKTREEIRRELREGMAQIKRR